MKRKRPNVPFVSKNKATRDLNRDFPKGTLVSFFDDCHAQRLGVVKTAKAGVLLVVSPPPPTRKSVAAGFTKAIWEMVRHTHRVRRELVHIA